MIIYRNAVLLYDLTVDTNTELSKKIMGEDLITANVTTSSILDIRVGDYTMWKGVSYEVNRPIKFRKASAVEYQYEVQFESPAYRLLDKLIQLNGKSEFYLTGSCSDFVDLIIANINVVDTGWTKGTVSVLDSGWHNIYCDGQNGKELLDTLAKEFAAEWSINNKQINILDRVSNATALTFELGKNKGLYELSRESVDDQNTATRAFVFGSTRNIPTDYRGGESRLIFTNSDGSHYLENRSEYNKVVEKKIVFEGIYPRFTGIVGDVSTDKLTITCPLIGFDVNAQLISGTTAKLIFLSGDLMGITFEIVTFNDEANTFKLKTITSGVEVYPSQDHAPATGDKFTLIDISMPQADISEAENLLKAMGQKWLDYYSQLRVKYTLKLDARYIRDNGIELAIGDVVRIVDSVIGIDKQIRITALKTKLDGTDITAEISNYKDEAWEKEITSTISDTIQKLTEARSAALSAGTAVVNLTETFNNYSPSFNSITGLPNDNDALNAYLIRIGAANADTKTELLTGSIIWMSGLKYSGKDLTYKIMGVPLQAQDKEITLQPADPNLSRIDVFYVDVFGNLQVATGTPAVNPTSPILSSTQLALMTVILAPGALTPSNINVENIYSENVEWVTSAIKDSHITIDFASTETPSTGAKRIKVALTVPNTEIPTPKHFIGENYEGGVIFYLDETGKKGLIVAKEDTAVNIFYSPISGSGTISTGATGQLIGTGRSNTYTMLANQYASGFAAKFCTEVIIDGFDEWFLPSIKELLTLHFRRQVVTNLLNKTYWSSSENAWNSAWCINFENGVEYSRLKNNNYYVRAIREFDDTTLLPGQVATFAPTATKMTFATGTPVVVKDGILTLEIKSTIPWLANSMLFIESYLGTSQTGSVAISASSNLFSYKPDSDQWQMIAIPMYSFAASRATLDSFKISLVGSWPNNIDLGLDNIRFQHSAVTDTIPAVGDTTTSEETTSDYGLVEAPNGTRIQFSTNKAFKPGSARVFVNGVRQFRGADADYIEEDGKIKLARAPDADDLLICDYIIL